MFYISEAFFLRLLCLGLFMIRADAKYTTFPEGANTLFIGHSYFIPPSQSFDAIASSFKDDFPKHKYFSVFAPASAGSPKSLWNNEAQRSTITNYLSTGNVELFAMTYYKSRTNDYVRWIDLALRYNPSTSILIGLPWPSLLSKSMSQKEFTKNVEKGMPKCYRKVMADLRKKYPSTDIWYIPYGLVPAIMWNMLNSRSLRGIDRLVGPDKNALFKDDQGHGNQMMTEAVSVLWLEILYGNTTKYWTDYNTWDESTMKTIVYEVLDQVEDYNTEGFTLPPDPRIIIIVASMLTLCLGIILYCLNRRYGFLGKLCFCCGRKSG